MGAIEDAKAGLPEAQADLELAKNPFQSALGPDYREDRDGQQFGTGSMTTAQAYYNSAIIPGKQKWAPLYRHGTLTDISDDGLGTVTLLPATSEQQSFNVNQDDILNDVEFEYMWCDDAAFEEGDEVLIMFESQNFSTPKIIGFRKEPKPCIMFGMEVFDVPDQYADPVGVVVCFPKSGLWEPPFKFLGVGEYVEREIDYLRTDSWGYNYNDGVYDKLYGPPGPDDLDYYDTGTILTKYRPNEQYDHLWDSYEVWVWDSWRVLVRAWGQDHLFANFGGVNSRYILSGMKHIQGYSMKDQKGAENKVAIFSLTWRCGAGGSPIESRHYFQSYGIIDNIRKQVYIDDCLEFPILGQPGEADFVHGMEQHGEIVNAPGLLWSRGNLVMLDG